MLFALFLATLASGWIPMRWTAADPASLELLKATPINCLLLENSAVSERTVAAASSLRIDSLLVLAPGATAEDVRKAASFKAKGVVFEGSFEQTALDTLHKAAIAHGLVVIDLLPRSRMPLEGSPTVVGSYQGVWPGVQVEEKGSTKAAPSGAPWINTNSGFLRFVRSATDAPVWIGTRPPEKTVITAERYLQAISDASIAGATWVLALDEDFSRRLFAGEKPIRAGWQRMMDLVRYFRSHPEWREMKPAGQLAIVQDADSGALLSGGVLDMIAVKHTPVRPVPTRKLGVETMEGAKLAVNVAPASLTDEQKVALRTWAGRGGTLLSAPSTWSFPTPQADRITLTDNEVKVLDEIWKEVNTMTGRRNLGVRLFNVSSMLSNLLQSADGKQTVLHLVNYSGYPVENVTVHLLGKFKSARLLAPGAADPAKLELYEVDGGSGVDIANVNVAATVVLE